MNSDLRAGPLDRAAPINEPRPAPRETAAPSARRDVEPLDRAAPSDEHHPGPLARAAPDDERHAGPLASSVHPEKVRKTERERRWERRRRRRAFEEVLGWILVPIICVAVYWAVVGGLAALGTTPGILIDGIRTALTSSGRV